MPSIKERYILLTACLLLIIPFARVIHEEYSNPHKKTYEVPEQELANAYWQLKQARLARNTDAIVNSIIKIAKLHSKDSRYSVGIAMLQGLLDDEVETTAQRVDVLTTLGDIYRDQQIEDSYQLAHRSYLAAIAEASKLDNKKLICRLQIKLINLCYLKGSDEFGREQDRMAALKEGSETIKSAKKLADEVDSKEFRTAIRNYSTMIGLEEHRLGLSDKSKFW
jgi:hypothetical protein